MRVIPPELHGRAFTPAQAARFGVTRRMLQGRRFAQVFRGVHRTVETPISFDLLVRGAFLVMPPDAALSHVSNLRWRGYDGVAETPIHISTASRLHVERPGIVVHRRQGELSPLDMAGVPILGPDRTFVDVATQLEERQLLRVGDWLVRQGSTDVYALNEYARKSHLDGVQRARRVAPWVRPRVDSPRESDVRWILMKAGLPIPEPNPPIVDDHGVQIAKGDLTYAEYRVIVEHDGWVHERDARQRQRDHLRRELLESLGWRLIVVTTEDFKNERAIAWRVYEALRERGYRGPRPTFGR
ncbi:DUF559 domain-containing protein [Aeromicrobium terrae]|uniref:DUF559 domain-containing protein n=1 Tax=Aeromicrobium terrae TaxID=2498846 RepID=A0A5C8NFH4_9ACTN|nr:DUF559 domain-containing protein [Aeromicrobium terrae]TXL60644.1 DUF559 domain-containing protein [Aeromicrobium terrae]